MIKHFLWISSLFFVFWSCEIPTEQLSKACENRVCQHEGQCSMGTCDCKPEYAGKNCEIKDVDSFVTRWKTDNEGISEDNQVKIPIFLSKKVRYSYDVDCNNDGVFEAKQIKGAYTCEYPKAGVYTIRIKGEFPQIYFKGQYEDNKKLLSVEQWGTQEWKSMHRAFYHCDFLKIHANDKPNLSYVTDMSYMFYSAYLFNSDLSSWDVSGVLNMKAMFAKAYNFNQSLNKWNVENVRNFSYMFYEAKRFNQSLASWNVSHALYMKKMFKNAMHFNQNLASWEVSTTLTCKGFAHNTKEWKQTKPKFGICLP